MLRVNKNIKNDQLITQLLYFYNVIRKKQNE